MIVCNKGDHSHLNEVILRPSLYIYAVKSMRIAKVYKISLYCIFRIFLQFTAEEKLIRIFVKFFSSQMAKILAKAWKDYKNSKKSMCLLSVEDRKKIRAEKKQESSERKNAVMEVREKKRQFFESIKQKKLEKRAKKNSK